MASDGVFDDGMTSKKSLLDQLKNRMSGSEVCMVVRKSWIGVMFGLQQPCAMYVRSPEGSMFEMGLLIA